MIDAMKAAVMQFEYILECINRDRIPHDGDEFYETLTALRQAIAQAEKQEPVALKVLNGEICYLSKADDQSYGMWCPVVPDKDCEHGFKNGTVFYTAPPKREWVGLTDEEFRAICNNLSRQEGWDGDGWDLALKQAIEAKLKEKNT